MNTIQLFIFSLLLPTIGFSQFTNDSNFRWQAYEKTNFRQEKPFVQPDTLVKCKILIYTVELSVLNGYCLCERQEQDFKIPPFGIDGWSALKQWDRNFKIVRVKEYCDKNSVVIPAADVWEHKFFNW